MTFFAKWAEGRIDDPNAGWKGKGAVGGELNPDCVPRRRRQGEPAQGGALPAAPRSTGAVSTAHSLRKY